MSTPACTSCGSTTGTIGCMICCPPQPTMQIVDRSSRVRSVPQARKDLSRSRCSGSCRSSGRDWPAGSRRIPGPAGRPRCGRNCSAAGSIHRGHSWNPQRPDRCGRARPNRALSRVIALGQKPRPTGTYLFMLTMQIGWDLSDGPISQNGFAQLVDGTNPIYTMPWGLQTNETQFGGGAAASYTFFFQATMTNDNEIYLKTQGSFYLPWRFSGGLPAAAECYHVPWVHLILP